MFISGSFNWYRHHAGGFVTHIAKAICKADGDNIARLRRAFPQMVAAHDCKSWDHVPEGFEPCYNGERLVNANILERSKGVEERAAP